VADPEALPRGGGVAQILGPEGRVLVTARAANVRRFALSRLGAGRPSRKGGRPALDLSPIATGVRYVLTTSPFQQRLVFERLVAGLVPLSARRDLKTPGYLHLDPGERFPRLTVRVAGADRAFLFGPFKDKAAAGRARDLLHKRFPLRPCDYVFEPHPELALGLGCVYAQVRTCAAPCLARVSESEYRELARSVNGLLEARAEGGEPALPPWVGRVEGAQGLIVEKGRGGWELYPVLDGSVLEEQGTTVGPGEDLAAAVSRLTWEAPVPPRDDVRWLSAWLHAPRRTGHYLAVDERGSLPARLRALSPP
jgi:hypothetical protein